MKSTNTFSREFEVLNAVRGVFYRNESEYQVAVYGSEPTQFYRALIYGDRKWTVGIDNDGPLVEPRQVQASVFDPLPEESADEFPIRGTEYVITRQLQAIYSKAMASADELVEIIQEVVGVNIEEILADQTTQSLGGTTGAPAFDATLGTDAYGSYLPFHAFAFSRRTPWGIYIFLEPLLDWTLGVWQRTRERHSAKELFTLLFLVIYRHEMFHYHVERFAFMLEVANRTPQYRPYVEFVRKQVANSEKWLEEALAQAVVLRSTFIKNRTFLEGRELRDLLEKEFKRFGPGYRDFDCAWTGGVSNAHRRIGTQIARSEDVDDSLQWVTDMAIPKSQYSQDFKAVPGYLAFKPEIRGRFQFETPKTKDIRKYWKKCGGMFDSGTGSSHENWSLKAAKKKVQFVDRDGHSDLNSFKAMATLFGVSIYELKQLVSKQG